MSIFDRLFKKKDKETPELVTELLKNDGFDYILKTAELISGNDASAMSKIKECIDNTDEFVKKNKERYMLWAIDTDDCDKETLVLTGFIDELSDAGFLYTTDTSVEFEDFADGITSLKSYKSMKIDISDIQFDTDRNALEWCRTINEELKDIRQLCCVDIGGEDLNLVWLNNETIQEIAVAIENTELSLEAVGVKQY